MTAKSIAAATLVGVAALSGLALAQTKPDCTPHKVEARIVKIDMDAGKMTLQEADGKTLEFQASKDTLQDKKVGDRLEITKRLPDSCK